MNHAINPAKPKASTRGKIRAVLLVTAKLIMKGVLVRMAQIEQLQRALKELIDLSLADFLRGQKRLQVEVGKSAIRNAGRKKFAQAARINGTKFANLLEHHAVKGILKHAGIEQPANLSARSAFDQHRAQEAQRISFEQWPARRFDGHKNQSCFTVSGASLSLASRPLGLHTLWFHVPRPHGL